MKKRVLEQSQILEPKKKSNLIIVERDGVDEPWDVSK